MKETFTTCTEKKKPIIGWGKGKKHRGRREEGQSSQKRGRKNRYGEDNL